MLCQLDDSRFTFGIHARDLQLARGEQPLIARLNAVVTMIRLDNFF